MLCATYILDQRTRLLTNPGPYLSTASTRTLTGHTPPTLSRLVDEGKLIIRQVGTKTFSYQTASVLAYCRKKTPTLSLFDLLASTTGDQVTEEELHAELDQARSGTWWTLARRDHAPPDWPTWQSWYSGNTTQARTALAKQHPRWRQQIKAHQARGLLRRTLWLPTQPLNRFGQYCLAHYQHVIETGGAVHVLPAWKLSHMEDRYVLPDLEVTPNAVYVRRYTRVGSRNGATRLTNPDLVASTSAFLGWAARQHTIPLPDFARWHPQKAA